MHQASFIKAEGDQYYDANNLQVLYDYNPEMFMYQINDNNQIV